MAALLTVKEVAEHFRYRPDTVWKRCRDQVWPHLREGRTVRFTEEHIQEIEKIMNPAPQKVQAQTAKTKFKEKLRG